MLGGFVMPLIGSIAVFTAVALLMAVFDDLPDFSDTGAPLSVTILYFVARMPGTLVTVIPFSVLLAVSFMTLVMRKNNELTAIRSAGISLFTVAAPVFTLVFLLCGCVMLFNEFAIPAADAYVARVKSHYLEGNGDSGGFIPNLAFGSSHYRRDWFFTAFSREKVCRGVAVRQNDEQGNSIFLLTADTAEYLPEERSWKFINGKTIRYEYQDGIPRQLPPEDFAEQTLSFREVPRDIEAHSRPLEQLNVAELIRMKRKNADSMLQQNQRLIASMICYRFTTPLASLIAAILAFGMTITQGRRSAAGGFVAAVGIFMVYYVMAQLFLVLGKNGTLTPILAGTLPTLLALTAAIIIVKKRQ